MGGGEEKQLKEAKISRLNTFHPENNDQCWHLQQCILHSKLQVYISTTGGNLCHEVSRGKIIWITVNSNATDQIFTSKPDTSMTYLSNRYHENPRNSFDKPVCVRLAHLFNTK